MKYIELLKKSEEKGPQLELRAEAARLNTEADLLATRQALLKAEQACEQALCAEPFSAAALLKARSEKANLQAGAKALEALIKELF